MRGSVKVVLLEPNQTDFQWISDRIRSLLDALGMGVDIRPANAQLGRPEAIFDQEVVDIFVTDISLGTRSSFQGLDFIQLVKSKWPDIFAIAITSSELTFRQAAARIPTFDLLIHKAYLNDEEYSKHLAKQLGERFRRNVNVELDEDLSSLSAAHQRGQQRIALERVLRAVTFGSHSASADASVTRVVLKPLEGGFSRSKVYRMSSFGPNGVQFMNAVLKLSDPRHAQREIENYLSFVKWYLPYTWRVELVGTSMTNQFGALCYSFAYNDDIPFTSLADSIRRRNDQQIEAAMRMIFAPDHKRWYDANNVRDEVNIGRYYQGRWFTAKQRDPADSFRDALPEERVFRDPNFVAINRYEYPWPSNFLFGRAHGDFKSCIRHGDLHAGNILVTASNDLSFIDFQETGRGHIFDDFVSLETSIRLDYGLNDPTKCTEDFFNLLENELLLARGHENSLPYGSLVAQIREYAIGNFGSTDFSRYIYALAALSYRLIGKQIIPAGSKRRLAACVLASIRRLRDAQ